MKICPVCENEDFSEDSLHCKICGTNLYNDCDGVHYQDYNGYEQIGDIHHNPSNARYCETCGAKTQYFKNGILCDYKNYKEDLKLPERIFPF